MTNTTDGDEHAKDDLDHETPPEDGPITLDRYLSRRRPPLQPAWMQIASLVAMLVALLLIFAYKDHCGRTIANVVGMMEGTTARQSAPAPDAGVPPR